MSGIGHFAAGFSAKPATPTVPLWVLLIASETNDILYFLFSVTGLESRAAFTISIDEGVKYFTPVTNPWSHGLFMSIVWSVLAAGLAYLFYRNQRIASIFGLVVFSHWVLDFLMHADLPLFFDNSPSLGLGLETSGPSFIFMTLLDLVLLGAGVAIYLKSRTRKSPIKKVGK